MNTRHDKLGDYDLAISKSLLKSLDIDWEGTLLLSASDKEGVRFWQQNKGSLRLMRQANKGWMDRHHRTRSTTKQTRKKEWKREIESAS